MRAMGLLVWALAGCGGLVTTGDAGRDGAPRDGGCPASGISAGRPCSPGVPVCLGDDRCNDCSCAGGLWVCGTRTCADAGTCPPRPRTGDACSTSRQVCDYGVGCSGAHCVCAGGRWTCDTVMCADGG